MCDLSISGHSGPLLVLKHFIAECIFLGFFHKNKSASKEFLV
jgi:hypothetical protein